MRIDSTEKLRERAQAGKRPRTLPEPAHAGKTLPAYYKTLPERNQSGKRPCSSITDTDQFAPSSKRIARFVKPDSDGHLQLPYWLPDECNAMFTEALAEVCDLTLCNLNMVEFRVKRGKSLCLKEYPSGSMHPSRSVISYTVRRTEYVLNTSFFKGIENNTVIYEHVFYLESSIDYPRTYKFFYIPEEGLVPSEEAIAEWNDIEQCHEDANCCFITLEERLAELKTSDFTFRFAAGDYYIGDPDFICPKPLQSSFNEAIGHGTYHCQVFMDEIVFCYPTQSHLREVTEANNTIQRESYYRYDVAGDGQAECARSGTVYVETGRIAMIPMSLVWKMQSKVAFSDSTIKDVSTDVRRAGSDNCMIFNFKEDFVANWKNGEFKFGTKIKLIPE
jgi:hypothetical protein